MVSITLTRKIQSKKLIYYDVTTILFLPQLLGSSDVSPSPQSVSESHTQVSGMQRFVICQTKYSIRIYKCNIHKL